MVAKRITIALVLLLIVVAVILCLALADSHLNSLCCQAIIPIMLLQVTYLLLIESSPQVPIIESSFVRAIWKPPRTV